MDQYFTFTQLIGLRDSNLSPYRDSRVKRYKSVQRMMDLLQTAKLTRPDAPPLTLHLDSEDPEWDDVMPFPTLDRGKYLKYLISGTGLIAFYAYNYNIFTHNIQLRTFRCLFPFLVTSFFICGYQKYRTQTLKINLFDQYCFLRTEELVKQNQYLFKHEDFERKVWWEKDFEQTLKKIYRQGNDNHERDFADSELLLQDFINRYVNPKAQSPMRAHSVNHLR